ncbi:hypothetical protein PIROE2DRAFT_2592 [Piromyces sp. E2]|nr:hypothetical protein PIROE2DRAFT_2592 [Piromyces sp. E2]|eukprot:OUM69500.1 hypothetical protein PIROE2DRAFT_2592 [Piromyces sp. E2]
MLFKQLFILCTLYIGVVFSRSVTFKVISFGQKVQVYVNGKKYNLKASTAGEPLYKGKLSTAPDDEFKYYYIQDGVKENFQRTCGVEVKTTLNEFYGREHTIQPLETFKYPDNHWNRSIGKTTLFDDSYIPTIHMTGNITENFFHNPTRTSVKLERVTFYLKDSQKAYLNVPVTAKNRDFEKFQIRMSLGQSASLYGRFLLKFRNGSEDPINLRQTIYGNINQAIGIPSIHSVMVRVYYNMKPAGFYTMQEEAFSDSFIRAEFYGNPETQTIDAPNPLGYALDCSTGSDFEYKPYNLTYYDPFVVKKDENRDRLIAFCGALEKLNTKDEKEVEEFDAKWFDIDTFHKAMAMEYLTGDWDGYWHFTSNFAFYDDPRQSTENTFKFYYITQDHDETFGVGLTDVINNVGYDFPKLSYTTMLREQWHLDPYDADHRTLVDKFIGGSPALQKRFQDTLISIVQNIFNPVAFRKVVNSYYERYRPEVEWDYSFERPYKLDTQPTNWNLNDFDTNFNSGVLGISWGLYEWVIMRAEAIKNEFCITWEGDTNPPSKSCVPYEIPTPSEPETTTTTETTTETFLTTFIPAPTTTTTKTTTTSTKTLPTSLGSFLDWFIFRKPSYSKTTKKRSI